MEICQMSPGCRRRGSRRVPCEALWISQSDLNRLWMLTKIHVICCSVKHVGADLHHLSSAKMFTDATKWNQSKLDNKQEALQESCRP